MFYRVFSCRICTLLSSSLIFIFEHSLYCFLAILLLEDLILMQKLFGRNYALPSATQILSFVLCRNIENNLFSGPIPATLLRIPNFRWSLGMPPPPSLFSLFFKYIFCANYNAWICLFNMDIVVSCFAKSWETMTLMVLSWSFLINRGIMLFVYYMN